MSQAKQGEPDNTPDDILAMVRQLAAPQHRLLLFLQQSSVEWCSSLWLDVVKSIDPALQRTIVVVSKFDNRLKVRVILPMSGEVALCICSVASFHEVHKSVFEVTPICLHLKSYSVFHLIGMSGCRNLRSDGK